MEQQSLQEFTSNNLARQLRAAERRRFVTFAIAVTCIIMIFLGLLVHQQISDQRLRQNLVKKCEVRNQILEAQRSTWANLITVSEEPRQREVWTRTLAALPPSENCEDYLTD